MSLAGGPAGAKMNTDREIGKIVLRMQNILRQIEREGDAEAPAALEATLQIAGAKVKSARRRLRRSPEAVQAA